MAGSTELDRLYYTVDVDLKPAKDGFKSLHAESEKAGAGIDTHMRRAAEGAKELHRGLEVNRRELLYAGREVATGDLARLPSTLILIATHLSGMTTAGIAMAGAVAGPFALMATASYQAAKAQERVRMAIAATGNAAGLTAGQVNMMAKNINYPGVSERGALDISSHLLSGNSIYGRNNMPGGIEAAAGLARMTGETQDKAASSLAEMMRDPGKAAKDLDEKFNLLGFAETQRILALKTNSEKEAEIFKALAKRGKETEDSMWSLSKSFDKFSGWISGLWYHTGEQRYSTPEERMAGLDKTRGKLAWEVAHGNPGEQGDLARIDRERGNLHWQIRQKNEAAAAADKKRADDEARTAAVSPGAMEIRKSQDEIASLHQPLRDRAMDEARRAAARQFDVNAQNPAMAPFAAGILSGAIAEAQAKQNDARSNTVTLATDEASAQERVTNAYRTSTEAGLAMTAQIKAEAEFRKGGIDNLNDYRDALMRTAAAQRTEAQIKENNKSADENAELRLEIQLQNVDEDVRNRRVALMREENDLKRKGMWGTPEGNAAMQQTGEHEDAKKTLKDVGDEQKRLLDISNDTSSVLSTMFDHANQGARGLKSLLPDLQQQLLKMAEQLAIINPLENYMTGKVTGTAGKAPTMNSLSSFAKMFFANGGAWSGGVRYAADGMVLGGPTMFSTGGGPVIGGEMGQNSEALMPLARGPSGKLGVRASGGGGSTVHMTQVLNVHPDVSVIARGEIVKMMPEINAAALTGLNSALKRGWQPGNYS